MFTFTLFPYEMHPTLLTGLLENLNTLRRHNPSWNYQLVDNENAHLVVLDFTLYDSLARLTPEAFLRISQGKTGKILVLLSARQVVLARQLMLSYSCSLLCVDERQLRLRELVESSLKNRRYISPFFLHACQNVEQRPVAVYFTPAERQIIKGLRCGHNGVEISRKIFRSQKTISSHKRRIMQKLGVKNDLELHNAMMDMQAED